MDINLFAINLNNPGVIDIPEIPLTDLQFTRRLSAPPIMSGTISYEGMRKDNLKLLPYQHLIVLLIDGKVFFSGIVQPGRFGSNGSWNWEAEGLSGYPFGLVYSGRYAGVNVEPFKLVKDVWYHLVDFEPKLEGLIVVDESKTDLVVGVDESLPFPTSDVFGLGIINSVVINEEIDCGEIITSLAQSTPFDYKEVYDFTVGSSYHVTTGIKLVEGMMGSQKQNVSFVAGENVISATPSSDIRDRYITEAYVTGAEVDYPYPTGEGDEVVYIAAPLNSLSRIEDSQRPNLRIQYTENISDEESYDVLARRANSVLARRGLIGEEVHIVSYGWHLNASVGSFDVGDIVHVDAFIPWKGLVNTYMRVLEWSYDINTEELDVKLVPYEHYSGVFPAPGTITHTIPWASQFVEAYGDESPMEQENLNGWDQN